MVGVETVREDGGLALSSRNAYLDPEQRRLAVEGLGRIATPSMLPEEGPEAVLAAARTVLRQSNGVDLDYLELTSPELGPPPECGEARLLIAARVGTTRLIDNVAVHLGQPVRPAKPEHRDRTPEGQP